MGFIKEAKADSAANEAKRAASEGHTVLVYKFDMPNLNSAVSSTVSGAAEAIERIEAQAWELSHTALHPDIRHGSLVMVFRRAATAQP
jgi:hypothetical protein